MPFRIELHRHWRWAVVLAAAAGLGGCSTMHSISRVDFPEATLNGQPAHFALDTGAAMTLITGPEAGALALEKEYTLPGAVTSRGHMAFSISEPVNVTIGENAFTSHMVIGETPKDISMDSSVGPRVDGVVGWPEIWDNILFFDGAKRTITAITARPMETAGWLRLRIHPMSQLTLEMPMANGDTGIVLVDTGSYIGVGLPSAQWKAWRAAHPNAPTAPLLYYTPGVGQVVTTEAWADEIQIGPLTLTDVPVHEANPAEMSIDEKHYAGTLGLYALSRMDMVLTGRMGVAYLKPLPPPGPYYSAFNRAGIADDTTNSPTHGDWTIEGPVKIDVDNLNQFSSDTLVEAGNHAFVAGNTPTALADLGMAIEINPKNMGAFVQRGLVYESENDFANAMADYTRALATLTRRDSPDRRLVLEGRIDELKGDTRAAIDDYTIAIASAPKGPEAYFLRGVDKQIQGDLYGAVADFDQAIALQDGNFPQAQIYREALRRWIGSPSTDLTQAIAGWDNTPWCKDAGNYLNGKMSEADFLAAADKGNQPHILECQTYYLIGINHLAKGDLPGARDYLKKCMAINLQSMPEYRFASAALTILHLQ